MNYYLAPLEGISGYIYRNAYHKYFEPLDKYFTPFLVPNQNRKFKSGELNDILPEHNQGLFVVPQLLTNQSEAFLWAADEIQKLGYEEINLNLGCPSRTVVTKGRGSGFLAEPDKLDRFLEQIFSGTKLKISIKTRIGKDDPEEFEELLQIFNKYPLEELIIHPRIQTDYYKNSPNYEVFAQAAKNSRNPVVYNGDIRTPEDFIRITEKFPSVQTTMIGRGILYNPGLIGELRGKAPVTREQLREFHDLIYIQYQQILSGDRNVLFKMKELWYYWSALFTNPDKYFKKIKKSEKLRSYEEVIKRLFEEQNLI